MVRLRRSDLSSPGLARQRRGKGFTYLQPDGSRVSDPDVLARIRALVIPPAWSDVWIAPWANGHIQAIGTDARGRRQYRYHDVWRARRDAQKFEHMASFAASLAPLRLAVATHLAEDELSRNRVLACATRLLDVGFFRIGTEGYTEENNTFGLATMLRKHVSVDDQLVTFDYTAKSGKRRVQSVVDPEVAEVVRRLKHRHGGGRELLAFREGDRWVDVRSVDINAYLKVHTDTEITAKDFRTWHATVLSAIGLACVPPATSARAAKRAVSCVMKEVASYLGNTPAVCRSSYVDPRIVDRFLAGSTIGKALVDVGVDESQALAADHRAAAEAAVMALISEGETDLTDAA